MYYSSIREDGCLVAKSENVFLQFDLAKCVLISHYLVSENKIKVIERKLCGNYICLVVNTQFSETTST